MRRIASVLPLLVALVCSGAAYDEYVGPIQLAISTNWVSTAKGSNVVASYSTYVSGNLYVSNLVSVDAVVASLAIASPTNGSTITVNGQTYAFVTGTPGPGQIEVGEDANTSATNVVAAFTAYPRAGIGVALSDAGVVDFTATPYGSMIVTASEGAALAANYTTNAYEKMGTYDGDTMVIQGKTVTFKDVVIDPSTQIAANTNNTDTTTNILTWLTAYEPSAAYSYGGETNISFVARGSWTIATNSAPWMESVLTTNTATAQAVLDLREADNVSLMAVVQGAGNSTANIIFQFDGSMDRTNWADRYVYSFEVPLSNTTANYDATNLVNVGWPFLRLSQVTNSTGVNLTNFALWYGYKR